MSALLTDLYQLTMLQAYYERGMTGVQRQLREQVDLQEKISAPNGLHGLPGNLVTKKIF